MSSGKTIVLSGGVGGAKLVLGLSHVVSADKLLVVTNVGDDFDHLGLRVCPDTDTVLYTLAGISNTELGWGRANESWAFMEALTALGGPNWFNLGDGDLALHVLRTEALKTGKTLTAVIGDVARSLGIDATVIPASDHPIRTCVNTAYGMLAFQEYFVRDRCAPVVTGFEFAGIEQALPNPALISALAAGPEAIIIAPSNPYVSVDPILMVPGLKAALKATGVPVVAVSPIVAGDAIKGPAAKMMKELNVPSTVASVARHYEGFLDGLIIDKLDAEYEEVVESCGMAVKVAPAIMRTLDDRITLARVTLEFARQITSSRAR